MTQEPSGRSRLSLVEMASLLILRMPKSALNREAYTQRPVCHCMAGAEGIESEMMMR